MTMKPGQSPQIQPPPLPAALQEHRALLALGLDGAPNIEQLQRAPNARDRKAFAAIQRSLPEAAERLTLEGLVTKRIGAQIVGTVRDFLAQNASLIGHLGQAEIASVSVAQLRATPSVFLERLLTSATSRTLVDQLLKTLHWYGENPGEQTPAAIRNQLLAKAIRLYLHAPSADAPEQIAGFNWQDRAHWGKSYPAIRDEFEQHLQRTARVANAKEAILLARLYEAQLSKDFAVRDIPPDLPYKSSVVWVNFMHGVLLAEALGLGAVQPLTFQQLVSLPITRCEGASAQQLEDIARLRLIPALQWAVCNGLIEARNTSEYSEDDIQHAMTALQAHSDSLNEAVLTLDRPSPERLVMARQALRPLFGNAFVSDGRKLVVEQKSSGNGGFMSTPLLKNPNLRAFTLLDVYAAGHFDAGEKWMLTQQDGQTLTNRWIRIDAERRLQLDRDALFDGSFSPRGKPLPDIRQSFETAFNNHIASVKKAYQTLIISLLASLPVADRQRLEFGEIKLLSLRKETQDLRREDESAERLMPLRSRMGFVLQVTDQGEVTFYELIPKAGVIRRRADMTSRMVGGVGATAEFEGWFFGEKFDVDVVRNGRLPLDESAHSRGTLPVDGATSQAILDQVGDTLATVSPVAADARSRVPALSSARQQALAAFIASELLFIDEKQLYEVARGVTDFDRMDAAFNARLNVLKAFVPFWSSIEDLMSGDVDRAFEGLLGTLADLASFAFPIGKFVSGSARLVKVARLGSTAARLTAQASLPSFSTLSRTLLVSSLRNLNPLDGIPTLLRELGSGAVRAGRHGYRTIRTLSGHADRYRLPHDLHQVSDPGRWRPLTSGDQLATVKGLDDVPVRNTRPAGSPRYHLVDPHSALPYGPRLSQRAGEITPGPSTYPTLHRTEADVLIELPENAHVRKLLEVDGRITLLIDDIPYRLEHDTLRRADLIDDTTTLKRLPCRPRRAPGGEQCQTRYVTRDPAPVPDIGSFDESKGWAPWFGDSLYTPATGRAPMTAKAMAAHDTLTASMVFQKGIYGRVKISIPVKGQALVDNVDTGATIVEAMDGSKHYIFTRLNAGDFYVAERLKGQSVYDPLTFKKASTATDAPIDELKIVYTGSLNANNMARIHGTEAVERAMKTMDEIAIPIGGPVNPPATLKGLKVDTSPAEAVLFDHASRMIVSKLPEGAKSWSRSKEAPEALRKRTAEIFDDLFQDATFKQKKADSALKIDETMKKLHRKIPHRERSYAPRNIAYAEVTTADGAKEIYVSVSGAQGTTQYLPLFQRNPGTNPVTVGDNTYFNIDANQTFPRTALNVTSDSKVLAVPHTIKDIDTYQPAATSAPTSLDSESKLISVIREKYPDRESIKSVNVATTMPPCDSCSVVMKQFAYDGSLDGLQVTWK